MIHLAPYTTSNIISKSIATQGGNATYRGTVRISKDALNSKSYVKCDTIILDEYSKVILFLKILFIIIVLQLNMKQQYQKLVVINYFI